MLPLLPSEQCCLGVGKHIGDRTVHDDSPLEVHLLDDHGRQCRSFHLEAEAFTPLVEKKCGARSVIKHDSWWLL